jgi:ArsR family transcriptional regulator
MEYAIETFSALSDPIRLRCLSLLAVEGEVCICEFVYTLEEAQPKISRHMKSLKDAGLVQSRKEAQWMHFRISEHMSSWQEQAVGAAIVAMVDSEQSKEDAKRLKTMKNRPPR